MKTLLGLVLKDKQLERYNVFTSLEEIKRILWNQRLCLEKIDSFLAHIEGHIAYDSNNEDLMDLPRSSARVLANISYPENEE